jgi:hypothetical protein
MKIPGQLASLVILVVAGLWVAAAILPRLLLPAAVIVGLVILTRLIFFHTRRW